MSTLRLPFLLILCVFLPRLSHAQAIRFDSYSYTVNSSCAPGKQCQVLALPGTQVNVCQGSAATLAACLGSPATTYADATAMTPCPNTSQLTPATGGACIAKSDNQGNFGWWTLPGSYSFYLRVPATAGGGTYGPYPFSVHGDSGGYTFDSNYNTLQLACAAAGASQLAVTKAWNALTTFNYAAVCPNMMFFGIGRMQPASGQTLTVPYPTANKSSQWLYDVSLGGAITFQGYLADVPVTWFGAVGDNSTSTNAAAFNGAINAVQNSSYRGRVFCPSGSYVTTAEILITLSGMMLEGDSNKSANGSFARGCHIRGTSTTADVIHVKTLGTGENGIWIRDLSVEGNLSGGSLGNGIHIDPAFASSTLSQGGIERVSVSNVKGDGILLDGAITPTFRGVFAWSLNDLMLTGNGGWGLEMISAGQIDMHRIYADGNLGGQTRYFRSQDVIGTQITESDTPTATNAVEITASTGIQLFSNHLETNVGQWFLIKGSKGVRILGASGLQASTYGMQVQTYTDPILGLTTTKDIWVDAPEWACSACDGSTIFRVDESDITTEKSRQYFWANADGAFTPSDFKGYEANFPAASIFLMGGWLTETDGSAPGTARAGRVIWDPTTNSLGVNETPRAGYTESVNGNEYVQGTLRVDSGPIHAAGGLEVCLSCAGGLHVNSIFGGLATVTFGNINPGVCVEQDVTVTGALAASALSTSANPRGSLSASPTFSVMQSRVNADASVRVGLCNPTSMAATPNVVVWSIVVIQ